MAKIKDRTKELLEFATLDLATFDSLTNDLGGLYEEGIIRLTFAGPRISMMLPDPYAEILMKKRNLDRAKFRKYVSAILWTLHIVLKDEKERFLERIKKAKDARTANMFLDKLKLAEKLITKYPTIKQGYQTYTFGTKYLEDLEWSTDLKVFHSESERAKEKHPVFPSATLTFSLMSRIEEKSEVFQFQISRHDVDYLIKSLQNLRESIINLTKKELRGETPQ